jgi:hypothetical protein
MRTSVIDKPLQAQRIRRTETETVPSSISSAQRTIHRLLCLLILSVIFEGIARKAAPKSLGIIIFFSKDVLTLVLLLLCLKKKFNAEASRLLGVMGRIVLLLSPCIVLTAIHDPLLAAFGMKQYALFPTVAIAMCVAYIPNGFRELFSLFRLIAFSVMVTTIVAVAQNRLPATNWLNLTAGGDDMSIFSAGGYLRVSSTFPFVGQYCFYLNALCYCLPAFFAFQSIVGRRGTTIQIVVLIALAIIGTFVTGSRSSVIGNAAILCAAGLLCFFFVGVKALIRVTALAGLGIVLLALMQSQHPELFAAYEARADGTGQESQAIEVGNRVEEALLGWTAGSPVSPPSLLGYGLGIMSNGSDKLSAYAAGWRINPGSWTETDQATTLFEGGWYLIILWNGFRLWVIGYSLASMLKLRHMEFRILGCFASGFILVIGITGALAIQPPLSIWWWMAVGLVTCVAHFDQDRQVETTRPLS